MANYILLGFLVHILYMDLQISFAIEAANEKKKIISIIRNTHKTWWCSVLTVFGKYHIRVPSPRCSHVHLKYAPESEAVT